MWPLLCTIERRAHAAIAAGCGARSGVGSARHAGVGDTGAVMATRDEALDFLIIGAGKSGTTSLAALLAAHSDVLMTDPKEPWFFDSRDYDRGMAWYWHRYLGHYQGEARVGEATSHTLFVPYAPGRLHRVAPGARLIAILRQPVERAYSDWWMKYCQGTETDDFDTAVARNLDSLQGQERFADPEEWQRHLDAASHRLAYKTYVDFGCYATQLDRWLGVFPREQIMVLFTEDLRDSPHETLQRLFRFIGVSEQAGGPPTDFTHQNPAGSLTTSRLRRTFYALPGGKPAARMANRLLPETARRFVTRPVKRLLGGERPPMLLETRLVLDAFFADEINRLEILTGRDLSAWKETPGVLV